MLLDVWGYEIYPLIIKLHWIIDSFFYIGDHFYNQCATQIWFYPSAYFCRAVLHLFLHFTLLYALFWDAVTWFSLLCVLYHFITFVPPCCFIFPLIPCCCLSWCGDLDTLRLLIKLLLLAFWGSARDHFDSIVFHLLCFAQKSNFIPFHYPWSCFN